MALQEPSWKIWLNYTSHLPLRMAVTTLLRDTFKAGDANTEMELPLYHGFMAANLTSPQLRLELPIGDSPEFRSLLHDLLLAVWTRAEAHRLPLDTPGDPTTLALRLEEELDANKAFASFVALVGAFARKRSSDRRFFVRSWPTSPFGYSHHFGEDEAGTAEAAREHPEAAGRIVLRSQWFA
jgi:hypothetical protein